jgi:hypothetical protein
LNRNNTDASRKQRKGKGFVPYYEGMVTRSSLWMNTRQVVAVQIVGMRPRHFVGVIIQNTGRIISSNAMGYCVVKTIVGCGTEIRMERSTSGKLQFQQLKGEKDQSISNEQGAQSVGFHRHSRPIIYMKIGRQPLEKVGVLNVRRCKNIYSYR